MKVRPLVVAAAGFVGHSRNRSSPLKQTLPFLQQPPMRINALHNDPAASALVLYSLPTSLSAVIPKTKLSVIQMLVAFVLGGIFMSMAQSVATNRETTLRTGKPLHVIIVRQIWGFCTLGYLEMRAFLRGEWTWRQAWQHFRDKFQEARLAIQRRVQNLRHETKADSARNSKSVGIPGLVPIQYVLDRLMPFSIQYQMETSLKTVLSEIKNPTIRRIELRDFWGGQTAPQLQSARVYDLGRSDAMAFDFDVVWNSELSAQIDLYTKALGVKIPVQVSDVVFRGPVRLQLSPLTNRPPGFGAVLLSLMEIPTVSLDVRVAGTDILNVSWLKDEMLRGIQYVLEDECLWPKRIIIPQQTATTTSMILTKSELELLKDDHPFASLLEEKAAVAATTKTASQRWSLIKDNVKVSIKERAFNEMDTNRDGIISKDEFLAATVVTKDAVVAKPRLQFWKKRQ